MSVQAAKEDRNWKELQQSLYYFLFPGMVLLGQVLVVKLNLHFLMLYVIFGIIPWLDEYSSEDWLNPTLEQIVKLESRLSFKLMLYLGIVCDWGAILTGMSNLKLMGPLDMLTTVTLMTLLSSTGFLIAHELFHKHNWLDRTIGTLHQIKNMYMHFTIEHVHGHHKRVSTPEDPTSAPSGMTVYQFIPRSIVGSLVSAFQISPVMVVLSLISSLIFFAFVGWYWGTAPLVFMLVSGFGSICLLEIINYIEHYGLQRKRLANGTYEKVTIRHSWNAPHRFSNYLFYKLQRHSDHHENSLKPYQTLCSYEESPQLPHGYLVCIMLAMYPKLWFDIMDPIVEEYSLSEKGTNLKSMEIGREKVKKFTRTINMVSLAFVIVELGSKIIMKSYGGVMSMQA